MSCPADANTGIIQLAGPIQSSELNKAPFPSFYLSFAPRSIRPVLQGNQIEEGAENTCIYRGTKYALAGIQMVSVLHEGYRLPGENQVPVAECILSYYPVTQLSEGVDRGILLCLPLFDTGTPAHEGYLTQLIQSTDPALTTKTSTAESLFYTSTGVTDHTVLSYPTCIETVSATTGKSSIHGLRIFYFSKGVHLRANDYQTLRSRMGGNLLPYELPGPLRNNEPTLLRYQMDGGQKRVVELSTSGQLYKTTVSTCTEEFRHRFNYMTLPNRVTRGSTGDSTISPPSESCNAEQYKCVPLEELSGGVMTVGNTTLQEVLERRYGKKGAGGGASDAAATAAATASVSPRSSPPPPDIEGIVAGSIGGILLVGILYYGATRLFNRPS